MGANSLPRRLIKRAIAPVLSENRYSYLQTAAMSWDIWRGNWYEPELEVAALAAAPGDHVLDIGANFGLYAYHLSKAVGPSGKVWAFEPIPFTSMTLQRVVKTLRLGNVIVTRKGCSDSNETLTFNVPIASMGTMSTGQAHIGTRSDEGPGREEQVRWDRTKPIEAEVVRLDDYLPELANISFIKCDVEGAETFVFRGAKKIIDRHLPTVVCEIVPFFLKGFGITLDDLLGPFFQRGYELFHYDEKAKRLNKKAPADVVEDNYVFVHPRRHDRFARFLAS